MVPTFQDSTLRAAAHAASRPVCVIDLRPPAVRRLCPGSVRERLQGRAFAVRAALLGRPPFEDRFTGIAAKLTLEQLLGTGNQRA